MAATSPVLFHRLLPGARAAERADRSALGMLPTRAFRYCDAVTTATACGWWLFPPMAFSLLWDGERIWWHYADLDDWSPLDDAAQFPGFAEQFDAAAPAFARGWSPPFLTALPEPGLVQVWTGLLARSRPGWALLLRPPPNMPRVPGAEGLEGLVEADLWAGPLFTNFRLTRTGEPMTFRPELPLVFAQPVPHEAYAEELLNRPGVAEGLASLSEADWQRYAAAVQPGEEGYQPGRYATKVRRRRRACPHAVPQKAPAG